MWEACWPPGADGGLDIWAARPKMNAFRYKISTAFSLAVSSILAHKLRSFLTLLGVIIGVAAVITMLAVGAGVYIVS